jgi:hypothetical protein
VLKIEGTRFSETLVTTYKIIRRQDSKDYIHIFTALKTSVACGYMLLVVSGTDREDSISE